MPEVLGCKGFGQLRWWRDFWRFQPAVLRSLRNSPIVVGYLVLSALVCSVHDGLDKVFRIPDALAALLLSMRIVHEVWAEISGTSRQDPKLDYKRAGSALGNSWLYGLGSFLGALLFLLPGIYIAVTASLSIVYICLEQLGAVTALEASRKLIQGHFWRVVGYLPWAAVIMTVAIFGCAGVAAVIMGMVNEQFADAIGTKVIYFFLALAMQWVAISIIPLQVRLYEFLKEAKGLLPVAILTPHADR